MLHMGKKSGEAALSLQDTGQAEPLAAQGACLNSSETLSLSRPRGDQRSGSKTPGICVEGGVQKVNTVPTLWIKA